MKPYVVELHYSVRELAFLLRFSEVTIRQWLKREQKFGPLDQVKADELGLGPILDVDDDIRVPASRVAFFVRSHSFDYSPGIKARNAAEMRRKLGKGVQ